MYVMRLRIKAFLFLNSFVSNVVDAIKEECNFLKGSWDTFFENVYMVFIKLGYYIIALDLEFSNKVKLAILTLGTNIDLLLLKDMI